MLYTNALLSLNALINSIWVGHFLGETALTAVANGNLLLFLVLAASFGIPAAAAILVSQALGSHRVSLAKSIVRTGIVFFALLAITVTVIGLIVTRPLMAAMHTPNESLPMAVTYTRVIFLALPSIYIYYFLSNILPAAGDSRTPFYFSLLAVATDTTLNPVLIFGVGPLRPLGVAGSALATMIAQTISLVMLVYHLRRRQHQLEFRVRELMTSRLDFSVLRFLLRKGIPMGAQLFLLSLSGVVMGTLVNRFGVITAAAFSASLQLWNYLQMPMAALSVAVSAMAAQSVGAQRGDRVDAIAWAGILQAVLITSLLVIMFEAISTHIYGLFLPSKSLSLTVGGHINRIVSPSYILFSASIVLFAAVRSVGVVVPQLVILAVEVLGVRLPFAIALLPKWQADAIWWSYPISFAVTAGLTSLYYVYGDWRSMRVLDALECRTTAGSDGKRHSR